MDIHYATPSGPIKRVACRIAVRRAIMERRWPIVTGSRSKPQLLRGVCFYDAISDCPCGMCPRRLRRRVKNRRFGGDLSRPGGTVPSRFYRTSPSPATTAGPTPFPTSADPSSTSPAMAVRGTAGPTTRRRSKRRLTPPYPTAAGSSSFRRAPFASMPIWPQARARAARARRLARQRGHAGRHDHPGGRADD